MDRPPSSNICLEIFRYNAESIQEPLSVGLVMTGSRSGNKQEHLKPEEINEDKQIIGRQIWRVVPYAKRYPKRVTVGVLANAAARFFDLIPFVAIGFAVDFFK